MSSRKKIKSCLESIPDWGLWRHPQRGFVLLALSLVVSGYFQFVTREYSHDLMWLSWAADRLISGDRLYVDIFEPNPPLIVWLYVGPVALANMFGIEHYALIIKWMSSILAVCSALIVYQLLRDDPFWDRDKRQTLLSALAVILLMLPDHYYVIGQREHLMVILLLPYIAINLPRYEKRHSIIVQIAIGIAAGIGIAIKPYFITIWIMMMLARLVLLRSVFSVVSASNAALVCTGLFYLVSVVVFTPEYFSWVDTIRQTYYSYGRPGEGPVQKAIHFAFFLVLGIVMAYLYRFHATRDAAYAKDRWFLTAAAFGAFLSALLQFKTWEYVTYPYLAFGLFAIFYEITGRQITHLFSLLLVLAAAYTNPIQEQRQLDYHLYSQRFQKIIEPYAGRGGFYYVSWHWAPPAVYKSRGEMPWLSGFNYLNFLFSGIYEYSKISNDPMPKRLPGREKLEEAVINLLADDIERKKPPVLILYHRKFDDESEENTFDLYKWFTQNARLRHIIEQYHLESRRDDLCKNDIKGPKRSCGISFYLRTH